MRAPMSSKARWLSPAAALLALALLAGACSSSDNASSGEQARSGGGEVRTGDFVDAGEPVVGGRVVYGLEADTTGGFAPAACVCAVSGHQIMKAVYDTLALVDENGEIVPNLATGWEHNDDYTQWTITLRDGVKFHDGTSLDGAAVAVNIAALQKSLLTQTALRDVESVTSSGQTVTINLSQPVARLPVVFSSQLGYVASPKWLAEAAQDSSLLNQPVGTGPFMYESYTPGNGNSFVAVRNPNYWREGLPYLDEVEFRVLEDIQSRSNALRKGEIDVMHTSNADEIAKFRKDANFDRFEVGNNMETSYVLLHVGSETTTIGGRTEPNPMADVRIRRALAHATDNDTLIRARNAGIVDEANGPFPPGTVGYLEETGFPKFDVDAAKALVADYEAENGPVTVRYATTSDPFNRVTAELLQQMWEAAGVTVTIDTIEQSQFILKALTGEFQAFGWRNHGGVDPMLQEIWWHSANSAAPPALSLNFGRIQDEVIDTNLDTIKNSDDPAEVKRAAEAVNRRFGEQVYNLWNNWTLWAVVANPVVHNPINGYTAPGGERIRSGIGIGASHFLTQAWVTR
ncbi:MAG TPA: ABC transporter substrate-binding protein [Acidimicrobiia bacterium]|nr:ABC transporter substrate-binding protein [Acidimicrobiia bacterium]